MTFRKILLRACKIYLFIIVLSIFSVAVYSYKYACLSDGEKLANGWTCDHQCCRNICVTDNNWATNPDLCFGLTGCSCGAGNFSDVEPPAITINSPTNGESFYSRYVLIDVELSEVSYLSFMEKGKERYGWQKLCAGKCSSYSRSRNFEEGEHVMTVRAVDTRGNEGKKNVTFYIDSVAPRIRLTYPNEGDYGNGEFMIEYTELNVVSVALFYKQNGDTAYKSISKTDCPSGDKAQCSFILGSLAQGPLSYYFGLTDRAQTIYSDPVGIMIDTAAPDLVVTSPHNPILYYNDKQVLFNLSVTEESDVSYIDFADKAPKYKPLCSGCMGYTGTKSFNDGYHNVTVKASDNAGNEDTYSVPFVVDSKKPRIKRTLPRNAGYGDGLFNVNYDEENPVDVTVYYKQNETDPYTPVTNKNCNGGKNVECNITINGLKQGKLWYYFSIIDLVGLNDTQKKESLITIDTVDPVFVELSSPENKTYTDRKVYFTANISEKVTLEYIDHYSANPTWKRLCTRCDYYNRYKTLSYDDYYLTVRASDLAGNFVSRDFMFTVQES